MCGSGHRSLHINITNIGCYETADVDPTPGWGYIGFLECCYVLNTSLLSIYRLRGLTSCIGLALDHYLVSITDESLSKQMT